MALTILAFAAVACGPRSSPLLSQNEIPPTRTPVTTEGSPTPILPHNPRDNFDQGKQYIKLAEWKENSVKFSNALAGYVLRHGFTYPVDVVVSTPEEYEAGLLNGTVDIVTEFPRDTEKEWYDAQLAAGTIKDIGTLFEDRPEKRIVIQTALATRAPEVVAFLQKFVPGDESHTRLSDLIRAGRAGFSPEAAAQVYFKENPGKVATWASQAEADLVSAAITAGRIAYKPTRCYSGQQGFC
ncbi:MAG: hypothetical protein FJ319_02680 [SAR202 cluster bacterium]|nr:hypothetical protein [SAR202 cluster bacterium]